MSARSDEDAVPVLGLLVECRVQLDPDQCPVLKGSAAWIRPKLAVWKARPDRPVYVEVHGYIRGGDVWARGCAGFSADDVPSWIPRPPAGWDASLAAVTP